MRGKLGSKTPLLLQPVKNKTGQLSPHPIPYAIH